MNAMAAENLEPLVKLTKDLRDSAKLIDRQEARWLVDIYYTAQDYRIRSANQKRASMVDGEPSAMVAWTFLSFETVEKEIQKALKVYAAEHTPGAWAMSIHGIGPVIAAGLLAHIDIERADTAGAIWRFAGLDPTVTWGKKEKRPWNAKLKRLCWIIGGSFVRLRASDNDIYGKVYEERKVFEVARNESGGNAETAAATLAAKKFTDKATKLIYESGKLPDGRIDMRARRYAVKLFLSHYHHVAYESFHNKPPPKPYIIEHGGHTHFIEPPNWPME